MKQSKSMANVSCRLTSDVKAQLEQRARDHGLCLSTYLRQVLSDSVLSAPSLEELHAVQTVSKQLNIVDEFLRDYTRETKARLDTLDAVLKAQNKTLEETVQSVIGLLKAISPEHAKNLQKQTAPEARPVVQQDMFRG